LNGWDYFEGKKGAWKGNDRITKILNPLHVCALAIYN
jgi:hypothetical protein